MTRTTFVTAALAVAVLMVGVVGAPPQAVKADPPQTYMVIDNATAYVVHIDFNSPTTRPWLRATLKPGEEYRWMFPGKFQMTGKVVVGSAQISLDPKDINLDAYHKARFTIERNAQGWFFK